jgi:integrase-like protein
MNGGRWRYEAIGPDREEADQALADRLRDANRGTYRERRQATFLEFASEWFASHAPRLRPSTYDTKIVLEVHLLPFFGDYLLSQIDAELIGATSPKRSRSARPATLWWPSSKPSWRSPARAASSGGCSWPDATEG